MPIDSNFPQNHHVIGKRSSADGQHFYFVWAPGREAEAVSDQKVKEAYAKRGEQLVPLGVHGTSVAVDWDSCIADGGCIKVCPVSAIKVDQANLESHKKAAGSVK